MKTDTSFHGKASNITTRINVLFRQFRSIVRHQQLETRQVIASMMIATMLLPVFSLPVSAATSTRAVAEIPGFEPANEELTYWDELFRDAGTSIESITTPYRPSNWSKNGSDPSKESNTKVTKSDVETKPVEKPPVDSGAEGESTDGESNNVEEPESEPIVEPAPFVPYLNELPDDERESIYTYENNLGAPPGQVEADSSNTAAAIPVRHRVGASNFSFGLPLAGLSGRGIDAGLGMTYNSRTWNRSCAVYTNGVCTNWRFAYDVEASWIAPGFSSGFGYIESSARLFNVLDDPPNNNWKTEIMPTGLTDPNGTRHQFVCKVFVPIPNTNNQTRCSVYGTSDGTRIQVAAKALLSNPGNEPTPNTSTYHNATWTTTLPGGTTIWYTGGQGTGNHRRHFPFLIQDRNGNRIRIEYHADGSGRITKITDTLNRQIKFYYEDGGSAPDKLVTITIPGMNTNEEIQTVRFYYEDMTLSSSGAFTGTIEAPATIRVLRWVYMPGTKTAYKYYYHPNYGMITKIERRVGVTPSDPTSTTTTGTIPVGNEGVWAASTEYDFQAAPNNTDVPRYFMRTDDWVGRTGTTPAETLYDIPDQLGGGNSSKITVKDDGFDVVTKTLTDASGMVKETIVNKVYGSFSDLMSKTEYTWSGERNLSKIEVTNEALLKKKTEFDYDQYDNQEEIREYGFNPSTGDPALLRTTQIEYQTGTNWINKNITNLATSVKTIVDGVPVSKTLFEYDHNGNDSTMTRRDDIDVATHGTYFNPAHPAWDEEICPLYDPEEQSALPNGCVVIHHPGYNSASAYRGNLTQVTAFSDATQTSDPNADIKEFDYDIAGNLVSATLSCCSLRTWEFSKESEYAFPVSQTSGSTPQLTTSATYNRNTGLVLSSTNENGQVTSYEYETDTLRSKKTIFPNGGYTETEYSDKLISNPADLVPGFVRQTTTLDTNKTAQSYSYFDGRGSGIRSAVQTPDGWSISAAEYDNLGRMRKSYNPFYGSTPVATVPGGTKFTEITEIDGFGRATKVTLQDDTFVTTEFSNNLTTPANFPYTFATATDQAGKKRRQVADALGRIVRVDEPDANGSLGAVDASLPNQQTSYEYDGNDNLIKVIQSDGTVTQERKFKYDSLSRRTHEKQIEANPTLDVDGIKGAADPSKWTKYLKYDLDGRLDFAVDARGVKATFAYDGLNRVTGISYTGETGYTTPNVTYTYDQARSQAFNVGALTRVETAAVGDAPATATEFDYDLMGGVTKHRQYVGTQEYAMEYGYNLAGQLTSQKYPSGRVVTNSFDANGRLAGVADGSRTYLSGLQYQGKGGSLSQLSLGNGTTPTFGMNDRLQMTEQELKKGSDVLQKYAYGYGQVDGSGNLDTTKNNGQLAQVESWIGTNKQWTQKFTNDSIGRLKQTEERRGDTNALTYKQAFDYDRFGNMYRKAASNNPPGQETPLPYTPIEDTDISKLTNRFATDTTYDDAGNVIVDDKFRTMSFGYDANGRMVKASRDQVPDALSVYDASGLRVAEYVNDVWRFLIYDIGGKLIAEYGGLQSTDEGGVKYVLSDWQGSTRAVVGNTGIVQSRSDYTAFGESIGSGTGLRESGFGKSNSLRQKYGLTERDDATGLDHTWFRKNENQAGRWTSPDPYNGSMDTSDPQSFNRYAYVNNQPTNFVDPSGLLLEYTCYDIDTYWRRGIVTGVLSTTVCHYRDIPDESDSGGVIGGSGGGGNPLSDPKTVLCNKYIADAADVVQKFLAEWKKYDPKQDAVGGIKHRWGTTKPFGHWKEMKDYQNRMNKIIEKYDRICNDRNDGRGGRGGGLPHEIRSLAKRHIPRIDDPSAKRLFEGPTREQVQQAMRNSAAQQAAALAAAAAIATLLVVWALNE